ncbi:uncharacterized protein LOC121491943 isoform X2 [Vulpes lagopus]|uniref:uncharacterized protein LOC121491943 isoform X2 n=1 Tax=Vulpes lagopus TaxID=494514 RepID=UPI001BCA16A8|nr:uncharacterized protein LOC121491943 isoform X2 [Vulpes lagopus]
MRGGGSRAQRGALTLAAAEGDRGAWKSASHGAKMPTAATHRLPLPCRPAPNAQSPAGRVGRVLSSETPEAAPEAAPVRAAAASCSPSTSRSGSRQSRAKGGRLWPQAAQPRRAVRGNQRSAREGPMVLIRRLGCQNLLSTLTVFSLTAILTPVFIQPASPVGPETLRIRSHLTMCTKCKNLRGTCIGGQGAEMRAASEQGPAARGSTCCAANLPAISPRRGHSRSQAKLPHPVGTELSVLL